jgi:ribosomal protein S6
MENEELIGMEDAPESRLYEVSFLLVPALAEEKAQEEADALRAALIGAGATIAYEGKPQSIALAYPMARSINHKKTVYESAYFGWFAFEKDGGTDDIKVWLEKNDSVIRSLIINTIKEAYITPVRRREAPRAVRPPSEKEEVVTAPVAAVDPALPVNEAELDKEIEHLLV